MVIRVILQEISKLCKSTRRSSTARVRSAFLARPCVTRGAIVRQSFANPSCSRASDDKRNNGEQRQGCEGWLRPVLQIAPRGGEGKSIRQGRGAAIIRRPLGPTIRPPERGPAVATSQSYRNSIVSRIAELRGAGKHRGRFFATAGHYPRANNVRFLRFLRKGDIFAYRAAASDIGAGGGRPLASFRKRRGLSR